MGRRRQRLASRLLTFTEFLDTQRHRLDAVGVIARRIARCDRRFTPDGLFNAMHTEGAHGFRDRTFSMVMRAADAYRAAKVRA